MQLLKKSIRGITTVTQWIAVGTMFLMMILICVAVISRGIFNKPILGDYEIVQLMMVVLVGLGIAHAERTNSHIYVGLLVDRFSNRVQAIFNTIIYLLVSTVCLIIGIVLFKAGIDSVTGYSSTTAILQIPTYPFLFVISVGFLLWSMEGLLKVIYNASAAITGTEIQTAGSDNSVI